MNKKKLNILQRLDVWLEKNGVKDYDIRIEAGVTIFLVSILFGMVLIGVGVYGVTSTLTTLACGIA